MTTQPPTTGHVDGGTVFAVLAASVQIPRKNPLLNPSAHPSRDAVLAEAKRQRRRTRVKMVPLLCRRDSRGTLTLISDPLPLLAARARGALRVPVVIVEDRALHLRESTPAVGHLRSFTLPEQDNTRLITIAIGMGFSLQRIAQEYGRTVIWVEERLASTRDSAPYVHPASAGKKSAAA